MHKSTRCCCAMLPAPPCRPAAAKLDLNLNPAGPLLLNALLQHLGAGGERPARADPKPWPAWLPALGSAAFGYWCAALLGVTSAAKASPCLMPRGGGCFVPVSPLVHALPKTLQQLGHCLCSDLMEEIFCCYVPTRTFSPTARCYLDLNTSK